MDVSNANLLDPLAIARWLIERLGNLTRSLGLRMESSTECLRAEEFLRAKYLMNSSRVEAPALFVVADGINRHAGASSRKSVERLRAS